MQVARSWLAVVLAITVVAPASTVSASDEGFTVDTAALEFGLDPLIVRVVELTNIHREHAGLAPLAINPSLGQVAQGYAEVLAAGDCFAHTCGPEPELTRRVERAGYLEWGVLGENLAGGQETPEEVVSRWMDSPGHRANILNPQFTEIGAGLAYGGPYQRNWTQVFGTLLPRGEGVSRIAG
ncbi:MAG TPA: CAP domain-containing protein [Chloroflexota bacterium]|jgi:uncharacterized protein YkwD|nr:CAP domain-containing protein [Chloroflexota bacterium]